MILSNPKPDYSSGRRMPSVKLTGQIQGTTTNSMPTSTSLQDINANTQKFNWNKEKPLINLSESILTSKHAASNRQLHLSQSDDRIFEHPEVTIKPSTVDGGVARRLLTTAAKTLITSENNRGSAPNILEHPDMKTPMVMTTQQTSSSSSSSPGSSSARNSGSNGKRLIRQQSADVYSTLSRTTPPANRDHAQTYFVTNPARASPPSSVIENIIESPEPEKSEDSSSYSPPPTNKAPVKIIREYSEPSSASEIDRTGKQSKNNKPPSEEDDFW